MGDYILVVGSVHLDVLADYSEAQAAYVDKVGDVRYAIGGTAFNIAAHLASDSCPVAMWTVLSKKSLITPLIRQTLDRHRIDTRFVEVDGLSDSGFVAHRMDGSLTGAVTSTAIERAVIDYKRIKLAIEGAMFVVADCNLSREQLEKIAEICLHSERPLLLSAVSEEKAQRILLVNGRGGATELFEVVAMNEVEAEAVGVKIGDKLVGNAVVNVCSRLRAKNVLVTRGPKGYTVLSKRDGKSRSFTPAKHVGPIVSETGAGDAVMAAVCKTFSKKRDIDWVSVQQTSGTYLAKILKDHAAFPSAAIHPGMALSEKFDVVVVCALDDPELSELRKTSDWKDVLPEEEDPTSYSRTTYVTKGGKSLNVIAGPAPQMGMPASAALATKMILRFKPKLVVMVGIAAGARTKDQNFGDILAANYTFNYGSGKVTATKIGLKFEPDPDPLAVDARIVGRLTHWKNRKSNELDSIRGAWPRPPEYALRLHVGPLASGAAVLNADERTTHPAVLEIVKHWRKLMAIEMEAHGVHLACRSVVPPPAFLCLKSACDFISEKGDEYQPYAAFTAAQFFHRFIVEEWENLHLK